MSTEQPKPELYDDAIVIDGLNVSNWASTNDYDSLYNGGVTAINATVAIWDGFRETLDNITDWVYRFDEQSDRLLRIGTVQDIRRAKVEGRTGASYSVGRTPRLSKTSSTVWKPWQLPQIKQGPISSRWFPAIGKTIRAASTGCVRQLPAI